MEKFRNSIISGTICAGIISPIDVLKTHRQILKYNNSQSIPHSFRTIYRANGLAGFYKGLPVNILSLAGFYGTFFPIYELLKPHCSQTWLCGMSAGAMGSLVSNPFYVLKIRQQSNHVTVTNTNVRLLHIIKNEGFVALFRGYNLTLIKNVELGIQLPIYERLKDRDMPVVWASFISKFIATTITYPIDTCRTILRGTKDTHKNIFEHIRTVLHDDGYSGLYRGYLINSIRSVTSTVIVFSIYELLTSTKS